MLRITFSSSGERPQTSVFQQREISIGRTSANDLVLPGPGISSHHARVLFEGDRITLVDLGSTNGTFVNGARIREPHIVQPTDEVYICAHRLTFEPNAASVPTGVGQPASQPPPPPMGGNYYNSPPSYPSYDASGGPPPVPPQPAGRGSIGLEATGFLSPEDWSQSPLNANPSGQNPDLGPTMLPQGLAGFRHDPSAPLPGPSPLDVAAPTIYPPDPNAAGLNIPPANPAYPQPPAQPTNMGDAGPLPAPIEQPSFSDAPTGMNRPSNFNGPSPASYPDSPAGPAIPDSAPPATLGPTGPAPLEPAGPATLGPTGPATLDSAPPATLGPTGPAPLEPAGPATLGPAGPAPLDSAPPEPAGPAPLEPAGPATLDSAPPEPAGPAPLDSAPPKPAGPAPLDSAPPAPLDSAQPEPVGPTSPKPVGPATLDFAGPAPLDSDPDPATPEPAGPASFDEPVTPTLGQDTDGPAPIEHEAQPLPTEASPEPGSLGTVVLSPDEALEPHSVGESSSEKPIAAPPQSSTPSTPAWSPPAKPPSEPPPPSASPPSHQTASDYSSPSTKSSELGSLATFAHLDPKAQAESVCGEIIRCALARLETPDDLPSPSARTTVQSIVQDLVADASAKLSSFDGLRWTPVLVAELTGTGPFETTLQRGGFAELLVRGPQSADIRLPDGSSQASNITFSSIQALELAVRRQALQPFDRAHPIVDARLPDGTMIYALHATLAAHGPIVRIRPASAQEPSYTLEQLVHHGVMNRTIENILKAGIYGGLNIALCAGSGASAYPLLIAMAHAAPAGVRQVLVRTHAEPGELPATTLVLEGNANATRSGTELRQTLINSALGLAPQRLLVDDVREAEAADVIGAMGHGLQGVVMTMRASSSTDGLARLSALIGLSSSVSDLTTRKIHLAQTLDLLVCISAYPEGRFCVTQVSEPMVAPSGLPQTNDIVTIDPVSGNWAATGVMPTFAHDLQRRGIVLDLSAG